MAQWVKALVAKPEFDLRDSYEEKNRLLSFDFHCTHNKQLRFPKHVDKVQ